MSFQDDLRYVIEGLKSVETRNNREFMHELALGLMRMSQLHETLEARAAGLQRRVEELEEKLSRVGELVYREGAYWREGHEEPGPYCRACWESGRKLVQLVPRGPGGEELCPRCRAFRFGSPDLP